MPTRIERFQKNPAFPFASRIVAPTIKILQDGMVGGPIDNEMFASILDQAYRQNTAGAAMRGVHEQHEKDAVLEWRIDEEPLDASQPTEDGSPILTKKYTVVLSGHVGNETFESWIFADIRASEDGTYLQSTFLDQQGGPNGTSYSSRPGLEESISRLEGYRNGIPERKLKLR